MTFSVGSVCSGIEAASVAWKDLNMDFKWLAEIGNFPSKLLHYRYPHIPNLGDLKAIPKSVENLEVEAPDLICGGTPCQAFSLAGLAKGLDDERGNLTLKFVELINSNDKVREALDVEPTRVFWENVEGVLSDKTNAFGILISSLAGLSEAISVKGAWGKAGILRGPKRNIAWRVLDAKYFGIPQQRRRVYVLAGGKDFNPENVLFERGTRLSAEYSNEGFRFSKSQKSFECFSSYTNCLWANYGTAWNGNASAYNGSLFIAQEGRLRRFSPLECERLMGLPDNYTNLPKTSNTERYKALGNSWAIPTVRWIGKRLCQEPYGSSFGFQIPKLGDFYLKVFNTPIERLENGESLNCGYSPNDIKLGELNGIVEPVDAQSKLFLSPVGCAGILRRANQRNVKILPALETLLKYETLKMPREDIERISRVQKRGKLDNTLNT